MTEFISAHWLDMLGTVTGLVYIWQEYKASEWLWITGIIMPVIYIFVYLDAGLYADFGMQVYYVIAAVYGLAAWLAKGRSDSSTDGSGITHFPKRLILPATAAFLVLWAVIWYVLITFTDSQVPMLDSWGNALSIIGLWALARKYAEQWWIWIAVDAELSALYVYKGIPFTAGLYALYTVMAVAGWLKWQRMITDGNEHTKQTE